VRGESDIQRVDRNFLELLQELRVTQTGVQILFAFLLGLAFTSRFDGLDRWQEAVYLAALLLTAASAALLIAPVAYHRMVFRRRLKSRLVTVTHRCAVVGLVLLLLSVSASVHLAASMVLGPAAALLAAGVALLFVTVWFIVPVHERRRHGHRRPRPTPTSTSTSTPAAGTPVRPAARMAPGTAGTDPRTARIRQ
jgi:O-antigen/teichoic acid export membrane protein